MTTLAIASHAKRIAQHPRSQPAIRRQGLRPLAGPSGLVGEAIETDVREEETYVYVDFGRPARDKGAVLGWGDAHLTGLGVLVDACSVHELGEVWAFRFAATRA